MGAKAGPAGLASREMDELVASLGGAPLPGPVPAAGEAEKEVRRRLKRDAKLARDAERPPAAFERFKILMEVLSEGRQVVEIADHKARYALVIVGVLNATVIILERGRTFEHLPDQIRPWVQVVLALYAAITFLCALAAINCLRPRRLHYAELLPGSPRTPNAPDLHGPRGVLYWEAIAGSDVQGYRRAWSEVHMGEINAELVLILHRLGRLIQAKYAALGQLYVGLTVLVALAAVLFGIYVVFHVPG